MKNESADVKPITGGGQAGYKCPPAAHRFRKGRSGHPSGRPKDVRNAVTDLVEVLNQPVTVSQGGEAKQVTKGDALVKVLMNMATKGDRRAVDALFTLMDRIERLVDPPEADKGVGVMVVPGVATPEEWKLLMAQKRIHDAEKEKQRIADAPKIEKKEAALRKIIALKQGTPEAAEAAVHLAELTSSMEYLSNFYIRRNLTPEDREALLKEPEKVPVVVKLPWDPDEYVRMPFHKRDEYARTHVDTRVVEAKVEMAHTPCYRRPGYPGIWSSVPWSELPPDDPRLRGEIPEGGCH
jgi:Family of unknown function (DUF5681)